jgi:hypothetical protein
MNSVLLATFWSENIKETCLLNEAGVDGKIILK